MTLVDLLAHPFTIGANRSAVTVLDGSDEANTQGIAVLALTRKGERVLVPTFGVTDPVFDELDVAELNVGLATFGPDVTVTAITVTPTSDRAARVELTYQDGA